MGTSDDEGITESAAQEPRADVAELCRKLEDDAAWLDKASMTGFPLIAQDCRNAAAAIREQAERIAELSEARNHNSAEIVRLQLERNAAQSQSKMDAEWGQEQEQRAERAEAERDAAYDVIAEYAKRVGALAEPTDCDLAQSQAKHAAILAKGCADWQQRAKRAVAERDAAIKDAERYRYLRSWQGQWIVVREEPEDTQLHGDVLDAAIDSELARAGEKP